MYVASSQHVYILLDEGRILRPLLGQWLFECKPIIGCVWPLQNDLAYYNEASVDDLLQSEQLRYMDAAEVSNRNVCLDPTKPDPTRDDYDSTEVHPILMLGVTAACIPFIQCNQSPRNAYQTSMGRAYPSS